MMTSLSFSAKKVTKMLLIPVLLVLICGIIVQWGQNLYGWRHSGAVVSLFDLDTEANIPSWMSSFGLLICSAMLGTIAWSVRIKGGNFFFQWLLLAVVFLGLSVDEIASIHEKSHMVVYRVLDAIGLSEYLTGFLAFHWIVLGIAVTLCLLIILVPFLFALPPRTLRLFVFSGVTYLAGVIGVESVGGYYIERRARELNIDSYIFWAEGGDLTYFFLYFTEEMLEMLGVLLFIYCLLDYMARHIGSFSVKITAN